MNSFKNKHEMVNKWKVKIQKYKNEITNIKNTPGSIENNIKITFMPGEWICKYTQDKSLNDKYNLKYMSEFKKDYMILDQPNPSIKVIHFAGVNDSIHNCKEDWVKRYWK